MEMAYYKLHNELYIQLLRLYYNNSAFVSGLTLEQIGLLSHGII